MRILDLQDLHSLRMKRGSLLSSQNSNKLCDLQVMKIKSNPQEDSFAARELASMYRSDLVITCSDYEQYILKNYYNIDHTALITFFQTEVDELENRERVNTYDIRRHFAWLGNFNHPPNLDAVGWLVNEAWPKISERIPKAELHLYGSNFRKEFSGLEKENQGIKSMVIICFFEY